ncbi:MAG TPA: HAMP domain-containing sensor histidine kinase [Vicinamibacteria bacterium]|nr:HAMP domain-containing sensor histidine kinase [Vicinamibacteria bacterium]
MSLRPRTLYRRIYAHGLVLLVMIALALVVAGILFGRSLRWRLHPDRLAQQVASALADVPDPALPGALARTADDLDVNVGVYADDGRALAGFGRVPPPLSPEEAVALHSDPRAVRDRRFLSSTAAGPGRYLRVSVRALEGDLFLRLVGALAVVVLVVSLVSAPLARAIARPLEHLAGVARRLGEGDLTARSGLQRGDEIGALARTLDEMAGRLEGLLAGQRELLANVSHELRTPLARIRMSLALAAEGEPALARRHVEAIEEDVAELEALISDLLTSSRLDAAGALALQLERVDPKEVLEAALARFARLHPTRAVTVKQGLAPALRAERGLVARVLDNLLDNAARYSEAPSPLEAELGEGEGGVVFLVRDHGIGIAAEDLEHLFTPFYRTDRSRARHTGGAGLGLALSRKIVESHGGRLTLESQAGRGTTVRVWLPSEGAPS